MMQICCRYLVVIVVVLVLIACAKEDIVPFEVTYEVNRLTDIPTKVFVSYADSAGYVKLHTTENTWSEKVVLKSDQIASLLVMASYDWDNITEDNLTLSDLCERNVSILVSGKIIHSKKTVEDYNRNVVLISLLKSETEEHSHFNWSLFEKTK